MKKDIFKVIVFGVLIFVGVVCVGWNWFVLVGLFIFCCGVVCVCWCLLPICGFV